MKKINLKELFGLENSQDLEQELTEKPVSDTLLISSEEKETAEVLEPPIPPPPTLSEVIKQLPVKKTNDNLYLYTQIIVVSIFLVTGVMLKFKGGSAFYEIKEDYNTFFSAETVFESNFSYESFLENFSKDLEEKHQSFTQAMSYFTGKGSNEGYPSNVSFEKYVPEEKGIKPVTGMVTSPFGVRQNPFNKKSKDFHTGMDIAGEKGTFIKSAFSGTVVATGYSDIAGNYIRIESDETLQTFYGHTQFVFVAEGDEILQGQIIATVGDSGLVTGPHLHFEVLHNGDRVNPVYAVE